MEEVLAYEIHHILNKNIFYITVKVWCDTFSYINTYNVTIGIHTGPLHPKQASQYEIHKCLCLFTSRMCVVYLYTYGKRQIKRELAFREIFIRTHMKIYLCPCDGRKYFCFAGVIL